MGSAGKLAAGLSNIQAEWPDRFGASGIPVTFIPGRSQGYRLTAAGDGSIQIEYHRQSDAMRAIAVAWGSLAVTGEIQDRAENSPFESLMVMIDVSRNAVMRPQTAVSYLRRIALMGATTLLLYTEDTYTVPGEPFFGHARGPYTPDEMREIDTAAARLGIELVPCIQTLGHLGHVLKWPAYQNVKNSGFELLVDEPATYDLVRKMILAATEPVASRRIHLGFDEASALGAGIHRSRNGVQQPLSILNRHLGRVVEICRELGLEPMIWSDMLFSLTSRGNEHYDTKSDVPVRALDSIQTPVQLVYWDYIHVTAEHYERQIERHRQVGGDPIFAAGALTWSHMWTQNPASFETIRAGMTAARSQGLKEAMITMWGNDGNECDYFSALPSVQFFTDTAYASDESDETFAVNFRGSLDATLASWIRASDIDIPDPLWASRGEDAAQLLHPGNAGKWILWLDPLLDLADLSVVNATAEHYRALAHDMQKGAEAGPSGDKILEFVSSLANALAVKIELHSKLRGAYQRRDLAQLKDLVANNIPVVIESVELLRRRHRDQWSKNNKVWGWEVLDLRYGALLQRLASLSEALITVIDNPSATIETLDLPQLSMFRGGPLARSIPYSRVASGSLLG